MMPSVSELLERASRTVDLERGHFERLLRRRDRKRRNQRIGAGMLAIILALVSFVALTRAFSTTERPADESPVPTPTDSALRRDGEVIGYQEGEDINGHSGWDPRLSHDLVAQNPDTGEVRTLVPAEMLRRPPQAGEVCIDPCSVLIGSAAWSADGRWAAYGIVGCGTPTTGLWVTNGVDDPRQLTTTSCESAKHADDAVEELWAWSPAGAQLAYARIGGEADELFVIDPSDGSRTPLGTADGDLTALEWSADGTRIAYADGGSVYEVPVDGGDRSLLAESFADIVNIEWSPDGSRIMVLDRERYRLQVMNADGSDLHILVEGEDACCDPAWSPDGHRIAYMLSVGEPDTDGIVFDFEIQIWTVSPDGSDAIKVFDSGCCSQGDANPVWSPGGTQVAWMSKSVWQVGNADGTGDARESDELRYLSWGGGWHHHWCECYG
jgi:Tol biopolymer transport system component